MDAINLGDNSNSNTEPKKDALNNQIKPLSSDQKADSIAINFKPKTPILETASPASLNEMPKIDLSKTAVNKPAIINLEIKKSELKQVDLKTATALKINLPSASSLSKPSIAWEKSMDISKDMTAKNLTAGLTQEQLKTGETLKVVDKVDFFNSSALQEKAGSGSNLMENITSQKIKIDQPKIENILGKSNILEKTLEQESILNQKKRLRLVQFMLFLVFIVALGANVYLYFQLSPGINIGGGLISYNFDSNLRNNLFNLNQSLRSQQTELNKYRFLSGQLYLNQFGYETSRFMDAVNSLGTKNSATDQANFNKIIAEAKDQMPKMLNGAKTNLSAPLFNVETFLTRGEEKIDEQTQQNNFQKDLKSAINTEKTAVITANSQSGIKGDDNQLNFYNNAVKLIGNSKFFTNLQSTNVENFKSQAELYASKDFDQAQRDAFKKSIDNLLASTKVNLATITNLKNSRIKWSEVINRIEAITNKVNADHNSGLGIGNSSQITYSGFEFNSDNNKVVVNGVNATKSGTNRAVITYLLEAFEASPEFINASNRSFPVSKTIDSAGNITYTMNFKIEMEIENGSFSKLNTPIADLNNLNKATEAKIAVKRTNN